LDTDALFSWVFLPAEFDPGRSESGLSTVQIKVATGLL